ncbi:MAG: DUF805 domain-containing protein [Azonexus sp.]
MTQQFKVIISGRTLSGAPLETVKAEAGRVFRLEGEQLEQMFSGKAVVVSRQASPEKADKLLARLQALDLEAHLEPLAAPAAPAAVAPPPGPAPSDELFALTAPPVVVPAVAPPLAAKPPAAPASRPEPAALALVATDTAADLATDPTAEMHCPKCGEGQPKRTLCRQCGTDMPRYLAARAEAESEARDARAAEIMARRAAPGPLRKDGDEWQAGLLSLGFAGRLGCLDYLAGTLLSCLVWLLLTLLAAASGKMTFAWLGLFLSSIYYLRCLALRLHDTGRTGWLSLVALVPFLGFVMMLVLLFIWGDDQENEHGLPAADSGGIRAIASLVAVLLVSGLTYRSISQSPEKALRFVDAVSVGQSKAMAAEAGADDEDEPDVAEARATVHYASNNRIDIYLTAACTDCTRMRAWLDANHLRYTVYAVDSNEQAAERLHSIIAGNGGGDARIDLPVLEINGKVLPGNPDIGSVHRQLRQEPAQ